MAIRLMQLLCANNHCLLALPFDPATESRNEVREKMTAGVKLMFERELLEHHCGLCGSRKFHYDDAREFATLEEAIRVFGMIQTAQRAADQLIKEFRARSN